MYGGNRWCCGTIGVVTPPIVLTVAAHDPLGGAGIAADLTTLAALDVHGMVAVTAVTAQRFGAVERVHPIDADLLAAQIDAATADCRVATMKVGLLLHADQVEVVAARVVDGRLPAPVVDPVMVDGHGTRFVPEGVETASRELLFPRAAVLTPNRAEAELLAADPAALAELGADLVVVTGGRSDATDLLVDAEGAVEEVSGEWIDTPHVRGSGCTFAAALTAGLAHGKSPTEAARRAKDFVTERLRDSAMWDLAPPGTAGPVSHRFDR